MTLLFWTKGQCVSPVETSELHCLTWGRTNPLPFLYHRNDESSLRTNRVCRGASTTALLRDTSVDTLGRDSRPVHVGLGLEWASSSTAPRSHCARHVHHPEAACIQRVSGKLASGSGKSGCEVNAEGTEIDASDPFVRRILKPCCSSNKSRAAGSVQKGRPSPILSFH